MNQKQREQVLKEFLDAESLGKDLYSLPEFYDAFYQVDADYERKEKIVRSHIEEESRILYLGCGTGNLIERLEDDYSFVGVEPSESMAEEAREKTSAEVFNVRAEEIDFEEEFDAVISFGQSMNYILKQKNMRKVFNSSFDSLKQGGFLIFDFMTSLEDSRSEKRVYTAGDVSFSVQEEFQRKEGERFYLRFLYKITGEGKNREFKEEHTIRNWKDEEIKQMAVEAGFRSPEEPDIYGESFCHLKARKNT